MTLERIALRTLAAAVAVLLLAASAQARELAVAPDAMLPVELATVGVDRRSGTPVVMLREPESGDVVPISIGPAEARAILMALHGATPPRPMTHDLLEDVLGALDADLERVLVDDLTAGVYRGMLEFRVRGRQDTIRVDTRPSDGLALAARTGAAILVSPELLHRAPGFEFRSFGDNQVVTAVGITVVTATQELRQALDLPDADGVLVSRTVGAAAEAGMRPGSLILSVNGKSPDAPMAFLDQVRRTPAGEKVNLVYWQGGEERDLALTTDVPDEQRGGDVQPRLDL